MNNTQFIVSLLKAWEQSGNVAFNVDKAGTAKSKVLEQFDAWRFEHGDNCTPGNSFTRGLRALGVQMTNSADPICIGVDLRMDMLAKRRQADPEYSYGQSGRKRHEEL